MNDHIIDTIADERDRLREQVAQLRLEIVALKRNQCGEQVGWWTHPSNVIHGMHTKPTAGWNPKPVYMKA